MTNVFDVAAYILRKVDGPITAMKLQKLVYYAQVWHLVWESKPIFPERIHAWACGPVVPELYEHLKGKFHVTVDDCGSVSPLQDDEADSVNQVFAYYGNKSAQWLADLTKMEQPWITARGSAIRDLDQQTGHEITLASIEEYYSSLLGDE